MSIEEIVEMLESHVNHESQMYPYNWYVMVGEKLQAAEKFIKSFEDESKLGRLTAVRDGLFEQLASNFHHAGEDHT